MEGLIIQLIAFCIVLKMYQSSSINRLGWFMFAILFIPDHFPLFSVAVSSRFFIFSIFIIFCVKNYGSILTKVKSFPLRYSLGIVLLALLITSVFDARLRFDFVKIAIWSGGFFIDNFLVVFLCYLLVRNYEDFAKIYHVIILFLGVLSLYGIYNILTKDNFYMSMYSAIYKVRDYAETYMSGFDGRFRISSFTWHPIYYGYLIGTGIMISFFPLVILKKSRRSSRLYYLIVIGMVINLLYVNSRTPLFAFLGGVVFFILFGLDIKRKVRLVFIGLVAFGVILLSVPKISEFIFDSFDTFTSKGSKLEGSSVEMRNMQFNAALFVFSRSPITGNGISYINENLGFTAQSENRTSDDDFAGFESYLYKMLIEQGIVGIIAQSILVISIVVLLLRHFNNSQNRIRKQFAILNLGMLVCFLLFIFGTGDLGTFKIYFSILGINLKGLDILKQQEQSLQTQSPMPELVS